MSLDWRGFLDAGARAIFVGENVCELSAEQDDLR